MFNVAKCSLSLAFIQLLGIKFISSTLLKGICFVSLSQEIHVTENCFIWLIQMTWVFFLEIFSKFLCQINFYKQNPMWVSFGIYFQNMLSLYSSLFFYKFGHDFSHLFQSPMFIHKGRTISLWSWSNYDRENISSLLSVQSEEAFVLCLDLLLRAVWVFVTRLGANLVCRDLISLPIEIESITIFCGVMGFFGLKHFEWKDSMVLENFRKINNINL